LIADAWFGRDGLWVDLNPGGTVTMRLPNSWHATKAMWWPSRTAAGKLKIAGRRLDGKGSFKATVAAGSGRVGQQPSALSFSHPGCWRITGRSRSVTLTYVLKVR
jgi:hypothetical protein